MAVLPFTSGLTSNPDLSITSHCLIPSAGVLSQGGVGGGSKGNLFRTGARGHIHKNPQIGLALGPGIRQGGDYLLSRFRSTIGVMRFNFSVRNGKRWSPHAVFTLVSSFSSRSLAATGSPCLPAPELWVQDKNQYGCADSRFSTRAALLWPAFFLFPFRSFGQLVPLG